MNQLLCANHPLGQRTKPARDHQDYELTKSEDSLDMAVKTLTELALGGRNDQLGGGFHRYSVDSRWLAHPRQVILEGPSIDDYQKVLNRHFLPYHVRIFRPEGPNPGAYLCENYVCQLPVHSAAELEALLS